MRVKKIDDEEEEGTELTEDEIIGLSQGFHVILVHVHKSLVFEPCQLSCLGSSVGRASVWNTECRGLESHLRQLSFFIFHFSIVSGVCLSFFLSFR